MASLSGEAGASSGPYRARVLPPPCRLARIVCVGVEPIELTVKDRAAWRRWLEKHHRASPGVWLTLAKKVTPGPTTLTYDEALEESLCFGWIDGQRGAGDGTTARQRFTHRGPRSRWSARNVGIVERLQAEGRMEPEGEAEVARAQADGRWSGAYAGSAKSVVPADLAAAHTAIHPDHTGVYACHKFRNSPRAG
jgi:uncharacterized protein YdeI (YjbR/CyaY-like superfamily)